MLVVPTMGAVAWATTGGHIDKLESIPRHAHQPVTVDESKTRLATIACASSGRPPNWRPPMAASTPLRDVTATVESIPLIASSIMSKKLAEGVDALGADVKVGHGAFMKKQ